jgi:hypothetical protein
MRLDAAPTELARVGGCRGYKDFAPTELLIGLLGIDITSLFDRSGSAATPQTPAAGSNLAPNDQTRFAEYPDPGRAKQKKGGL